ncbi:small conductance mechanosensitive channel [Arachidicoccus rhizosphaerae]|uniref:Small conductance mechanosensitive channel n=1 Tax=Arachidicoccus rhizosphaerae TaxID=551991 RepID=A0A1H4A6P3_9BACT|nr:mechanosensitive ion channel family protein [Arachidicoccus rhizosphaerae]SEA31124.1 small conductance mechanosensitive channel [Arachidicoccus rhizosphaerae]
MINTLLLQSVSELGKSTTKEVVGGFKDLRVWEDMSMLYLPKIIAALIIGFVGYWLIKWVGRLFIKLLQKRNIDSSLQTFLTSIVRISMMVFLILTVISILGISITGFAALLAGAGIALGSTLNGTLGNFAGGVMILILKPFKVGDLIEAQGQFGLVIEIGIVYTSVLTSQNKTIRLPNGALSTGVINNYTDQDNLRIDIKVPVADYTNVDKARQVAIEAMKTIATVISDPAPDVKVTELTGDGPVLVVWPRIKIKPYDPKNPRQMEADYYSVYFGVRKAVYDAFVLNNIPTPSNTFEVTMMGERAPHKGFDV